MALAPATKPYAFSDEVLNAVRVVTVDGSELEWARSSILPYTQFYNDAINEALPLKDDYQRGRDGSFAFTNYPFLLDPAGKSRLLQLQAHQMMVEQFEQAVLSFFAMRQSPYLVFHVDRHNLIQTTLNQLHDIPPRDLQKPLKVRFEGEEGIDEGGVQKEFFQLVVRELFMEGYDMFTYDNDTRLHWFNKDTMTSSVEFELIGTILGLAIYNSVILDVHFPRVVYKKLLGERLTWEDFKEIQPVLARSFEHLLKFDGDVESVFCATFAIDYEIFGQHRTVELKEGGGSVTVTNANRGEYVDLYVDYVLNKSIQRQFQAFAKGFRKVCSSELFRSFHAEELELLICGSRELDFEALEATCRYEDGYRRDDPTIRNFWAVVHTMNAEDKRKLLQFCTGSDRVPIKGLGTLSFTISRHGPDSDTLPISHTCFNHLLLPDYATREKLERQLRIAIANSQGFGLR